MEVKISKAIIDGYFKKLNDNLEIDCAIVGGGPSGLIAGYFLAKAGKKVAMFESKLTIGGGIWGGGMLFNEIVVQEDAKKILDILEINTKELDSGLYTADSIEVTSGMIYRAKQMGLTVFNGITVEDVIFKHDKIDGVVINWTPVLQNRMHVDPLMIQAKTVLDGTGHPSEISKVAMRKAGIKLNTETGGIMGEKPMWVEKGEASTVENTKEIYNGLFVSGMAANAVYGAFRMGPIFGGMIKSGQKAAKLIMEKLDKLC